MHHPARGQKTAKRYPHAPQHARCVRKVIEALDWKVIVNKLEAQVFRKIREDEGAASQKKVNYGAVLQRLLVAASQLAKLQSGTSLGSLASASQQPGNSNSQ